MATGCRGPEEVRVGAGRAERGTCRRCLGVAAPGGRAGWRGSPAGGRRSAARAPRLARPSVPAPQAAGARREARGRWPRPGATARRCPTWSLRTLHTLRPRPSGSPAWIKGMRARGAGFGSRGAALVGCHLRESLPRAGDRMRRRGGLAGEGGETRRQPAPVPFRPADSTLHSGWVGGWFPLALRPGGVHPYRLQTVQALRVNVV